MHKPKCTEMTCGSPQGFHVDPTACAMTGRWMNGDAHSRHLSKQNPKLSIQLLTADCGSEKEKEKENKK